MKTSVAAAAVSVFAAFNLAIAQTIQTPSPTPSPTSLSQWRVVTTTDPKDNTTKTTFALEPYVDEGGPGLGQMSFACWDAHDPKLWGRTFLIEVPMVPMLKVTSPAVEFQLDDEPTFSQTGKGIIPDRNGVFFDLGNMEDAWKDLLPRVLQAKRLQLTVNAGGRAVLFKFHPSGIDLQRFREACNLPGLLSKPRDK